MKKNYQSFIFEDYTFWPQEKKLLLRYSFDGELFFTEEILFDFDFAPDFDKLALGKILHGLFLMCGISYYKAFLPPQIKCKTRGLTKFQAAFFEKIYQNGLAEFFFCNNLPLDPAISFPVDPTKENKALTLPDLEGSLVPLGGGKDSLTTVEILKAQGEAFETWTVGDFPALENMIQKINRPHLQIRRIIDPKLFELNAQGVYNGHVPISSILAFLSMTTAILKKKKNVLFSNESSANEPTIVVNGKSVNHQYSKSLEFEKDFQAYLQTCVSADLQYFSFLRPLSELRIAEIFCQNFFHTYADIFSSCNKNFRQKNTASQLQWCGKCPKCAFVFLIFSPFLERETLISLFGENLFLKSELQKTFRELLGQESQKPFECVGEIREVQAALRLAQKTNQWPELKSWDIPETKFDFRKFSKHAVPRKFEHMISPYIAS